jgi:DNA-binding transcriptional ArsR family regulator
VKNRAEAVANAKANRAIILAALTESAKRGAACPSNHQLVKLIGGGSPARVSWIITKLEEAGLIEVDRFQDARIITIADTGRSTASLGVKGNSLHMPRGGVKARRASPINRVEDRFEPPVPEVLPMPRVSCPWCGVTSMVGCSHLHRAGLIEPKAIAA